VWGKERSTKEGIGDGEKEVVVKKWLKLKGKRICGREESRAAFGLRVRGSQQARPLAARIGSSASQFVRGREKPGSLIFLLRFLSLDLVMTSYDQARLAVSRLNFGAEKHWEIEGPPLPKLDFQFRPCSILDFKGCLHCIQGNGCKRNGY
jgi:hypothetical protein